MVHTHRSLRLSAGSQVFTQIVSEHFIEHGQKSDIEEFWGSLPTAMYTLFMAISNGISWYDAVGPLHQVSIAMVMLFSGYIFVTQFVVLNVLTGIFCQVAIDTVNQDPDLASQSVMLAKKNFAEKLMRFFMSVDEDGSGEITLDELENLLIDENMQGYLAAMGIDAQDAWSMFKLIDSDKSHTIDKNEFISGIMRLRGNAKGLDLAVVMEDQRWMLRCMENLLTSDDVRQGSLSQDAPLAASPRVDPSRPRSPRSQLTDDASRPQSPRVQT